MDRMFKYVIEEYWSDLGNISNLITKMNVRYVV